MHRIVLAAPFWGPAPGSNRWHDYEYAAPSGEIVAPGEAVRAAVTAGLLTASRHDRPGIVLADPDGGEIEMCWRYSATVAHA